MGLIPGCARAADNALFVDFDGKAIVEAAVPEDLRIAVQALVATENRGIDLEKCALVLARVSLPGDESDPHFASVLHGKDWAGGMHFLTAGHPPNAVCIRLSRFDAPCTLELTKPDYRSVSQRVPIDQTRGKIIWLGEINLERAPVVQLNRPVPPPVAVETHPVPDQSQPVPPARMTTPVSPAPGTNRVNNLTYQQLNELFGIPLWTSDQLWAEEGETVRQRLGLGVESQGDSESSRSSALGHPKDLILGEKAEEMRLTSSAKLVSEVMIMFANRGDSVPIKPELKDYKHRDADFRKDNKIYEEAKSALHNRIRVAFTNVAERLTAVLGEHKRSSFGAGGNVREPVKVWLWKDHAILLTEKPGIGVILRMMPVAEALTRGSSEQIRGSDLKKELLSRVQYRTNGDVVIGGIPMVSQESKGWCAIATSARYLQYFGIAVDEYMLGLDDRGAMEKICMQYHRQLVGLSAPLSLPFIAEHINKGLPLMWGMSAVDPFEQLGRPPNRMGDLSPEAWLEKLRPDRDKARKIAKYKYLGLRAHCCMIIGYNKLTKEVATSDSWGPFAQERWFPLEAAQNVSGDNYSVIHW